MKITIYASFFTLIAGLVSATIVHSHGDVTPQAVATKGLPELGEDWLDQNPWRDPDNEYWLKAIEVGASGYNQNCARCHGLEAVSGGLAPDLRLLSADYDGDEWYLERFRNGATQNGITKMPGFELILSQEAAWAIRTYVETRPADGALGEYNSRLKEIRDQLKGYADKVAAGGDSEEFDTKAQAIKAELAEINTKVETGSGAPVAESAVSRAAAALDNSSTSYAKASELLTIGLSAAQ